MVFKHFLQFCADLSKKFKYIKAIYLYASKMSRCALSENSEINHKINHKIFWKSVKRTFRCAYGNCFDRIRFLAEVSTKLPKKCPFLDNLRTITQRKNLKTRQMTPFFSSTSWSPTTPQLTQKEARFLLMRCTSNSTSSTVH